MRGYRVIQPWLRLFVVGCTMTRVARTRRVCERLRKIYDRSGCIRVYPYDPENGRAGRTELRIVANDLMERLQVMGALEYLGIPYSKPYLKKRHGKGNDQWIVPIYKRVNILRFLEIVKPKDADTLYGSIVASIVRYSDAEVRYLEPPM